MIAIPAIDLKGGRVVRLLHGDFKEEKVYPQKPGEAARQYQSEGAERLHVVDLDGALKGAPANRDGVEAILRSVKVPIEVGGGIRDIKTAVRYLDMGVRWVILGTQACLDEGFLREALGELGERVIVGIDAMNGLIATDGWTRVTKMKAHDLAKQVEALGGKTVIYTDISKDGALKGPNIPEIEALSKAVALQVIASGGVSSLDDLKRLKALGRENIIGVIIGKALYENKFQLKDALRTCLQNG